LSAISEIKPSADRRTAEAKPRLSPRARRRRLRNRLIIATAAVLAAVTAILLSTFLRVMQTYDFKGESLHYDVGTRFAHSAATKINRADGRVTLEDGSDIFPLDSIPVFFKGEHKLIIPENMSIIVPEESRSGKLEFFTTVEERADGGYLMTPISGGRRAETDGGFLFDGRDLYIFLEEVEISWGDSADEKITLAPMSYMVVLYNLRIEIYPRDASEGILLDTGMARVMAYFRGYSVDLSKDILYRKGQEMLLFTNPSVLKPFGRG
jgi:hypothetical protein